MRAPCLVSEAPEFPACASPSDLQGAGGQWSQRKEVKGKEKVMMNKLFERHPTREVSTHLPETHEVLPELPDDVTIPDDISGLTHPATTEDRRPASGIRWVRAVLASPRRSSIL